VHTTYHIAGNSLAFPGIANRTIYPGNIAKWTIDVKALPYTNASTIYSEKAHDKPQS
jgi:hypothetical protein